MLSRSWRAWHSCVRAVCLLITTPWSLLTFTQPFYTRCCSSCRRNSEIPLRWWHDDGPKVVYASWSFKGRRLNPLLWCCNQVHGQEQRNNQDQAGGDQEAKRAFDITSTATGKVQVASSYLLFYLPKAKITLSVVIRSGSSLWQSFSCCPLRFHSDIWAMAQAPRDFLWQMSSNMPWSLPPASLCAPPLWKILTQLHPQGAQQDNSHSQQGKFQNSCLLESLLLIHYLQC